ncbi:MAG: acyltransferase [Lachnospiraceae bacterium]|nr:acyltransferase [Lachnospiraceae bacterium]MBQ8317305.1 acyltransferase [Lachnospiraceae bacterium]
MAEKRKRDSGIEVLRILAIMMVIGLHVFKYGNYYEQAELVGGFVRIISIGIRVLFIPAVDIFVLISGYFMVKMRFNIKKAYKRVFKIYAVILFYSVVLSLLSLLLGPEFHSINGNKDSLAIIIARMVLPITSQTWYFLSHYIVMCLLAPFVNIILQNIKKNDYHVLLVVTTFLMSIWFMMAHMRFLDKVVTISFFSDIKKGMSVFSFLYLYIIGGYIWLHTEKNDKPNIKYILFALGCLITNGLLFTVLEKTLELNDVVLYYSNPFVILMAVMLLMYFKDLHFHSKIINALASTTIGVYAIHEFRYVRELLWNMFDFRKVDCSNMFLNMVYIISIIVMVFGVCAIIDLLRQKLFRVFEKQEIKSSASVEG